jgi:hypothetical protein
MSASSPPLHHRLLGRAGRHNTASVRSYSDWLLPTRCDADRAQAPIRPLSCRVVRIFPNEIALVRLAGAVLVDMHEEWIAAECRYFFKGSMAKLHPDREVGEAIDAELESGG